MVSMMCILTLPSPPPLPSSEWIVEEKTETIYSLDIVKCYESKVYFEVERKSMFAATINQIIYYLYPNTKLVWALSVSNNSAPSGQP